MSHAREQNGGPAFPASTYESGVGHHGMSLEDYYCCQVTGALVSRLKGDNEPEMAELRMMARLGRRTARYMVKLSEDDDE